MSQTEEKAECVKNGEHGNKRNRSNEFCCMVEKKGMNISYDKEYCKITSMTISYSPSLSHTLSAQKIPQRSSFLLLLRERCSLIQDSAV